MGGAGGDLKAYLALGGSQAIGHLFDRKIQRLDRARSGSAVAPPLGSRIPSASSLEPGFSLVWCSDWSSGTGTPKLAPAGPHRSSLTSSSWDSLLALFSSWSCSSSSAHGVDAIPGNDHSMGVEGDAGDGEQGHSSNGGTRELVPSGSWSTASGLCGRLITPLSGAGLDLPGEAVGGPVGDQPHRPWRIDLSALLSERDGRERLQLLKRRLAEVLVSRVDPLDHPPRRTHP